MNKLFYLPFLLLIFSCEDYIGGDFNADPNNPITVPVANQLPAIQIALVDTYAGQYSRLTSMLTQQVEGVARICSQFYRYEGLTPDRFVTLWNNIYEKVLNEIKIAKTQSKDQNLNHHLAILQIMEAFTLMISTDVWDDIPYSMALQGLDNSEPLFDDQEIIYEVIFELLDQSIDLLNGPAGSLVLGTEDLYLNGNIDAWIKAAYAIKARGLLHFDDYEDALSAAENAFTTSEENLGYHYTGTDAAFNWYRFNRDRTGDIEFSPFMRELMQTKQDSFRLAVFDQSFWINHPYITADHFFELISYREIQFLIAEIDVRNTDGGSSLAYQSLLNGVRASFKKAGLSDEAFDTYITNPQFPTEGSLSLEAIMLEKYIALFLQPETYNDFRRTGYPDLIPVSGSMIPVRWHYSAHEHEFNPHAPAASTINIFTDRVGWNR